MPRTNNNALVLSDTQRLILSFLVRLRFATTTQLMFWLGVDHASSVTRPCSQLIEAGMIERHDELTPYVFRLSRRGSKVMGARYSRDWYSLSALQQYALKNEIEIQLSERFGNVRSISRDRLLTLGLSPSVGEHAYRFERQLFFVIIDDYLMESKRIHHSWSRIHKSNSKYYDLKQGSSVSWKGYSDRFILYCCDESKLELHKKMVTKTGLAVECLYIDPFWGIAA